MMEQSGHLTRCFSQTQPRPLAAYVIGEQLVVVRGFKTQPPAGADTHPLGRGPAQPGAVGWGARQLGHVAGGRGGHCGHSGCCVAVALMATHAPSAQEPRVPS